ncbi:MAG TPA: hypothetical protein VF105_03355 [Gemmatimonadaceae bacterium]
MTNPPEISVFLKVVGLVSLLALGPAKPATILLDGTAQPCADVKETTSGIPGVRVYAFNAAKIPSIRQSLYVLDTLDFENGNPDAMRAAAVEYNRLIARVQKAKKLGYAMSNGNGDFEITVPQMDSVLVFGETKMPGEPFYYSSRVVAAVDKEEVRVILLMCNQQLL